MNGGFNGINAAPVERPALAPPWAFTGGSRGKETKRSSWDRTPAPSRADLRVEESAAQSERCWKMLSIRGTGKTEEGQG